MNTLGDLKRHDKQYREALPLVRAGDREWTPINYDALYGAGASQPAFA